MASGASQKGLTLRSALNTGTALLNAFASIAVNLIVSPILLNMIGTTEFGVWKFCNRLLSFVSAADGQATQALKWTITNSQESDDLEAKQRDIGSALIVWVRLLPIFLVIGGVLSWYAPLMMNDLDLEYYGMARLTCALLVAVLVFTPLKVIPQTVMVGLNRGYEVQWVNAVELVLQGVFIVGLAAYGLRAEGPAWATLVATILAGITGLSLTRRALPWFRARRPSRAELRKFFGFSIWVLVWSIESRFVFASDLILLGIIASPAVVTSFSLTSYVVVATALVVLALVNGAIPGLGGLIGSGKLERASRVREEIVRLSWLLSVVILGVVLISNEAFVSLWVGPENFLGHNANLLIVLGGLQQSLIRADSNIINVTLDIRAKVLLGFASAALCVGLAFALPPLFHERVAGVLVGLLVGRMLLSIAFPVLVHRALDEKFSILKSGRLVLTTALLFGGASYAGRTLSIDGWFELVIVSAIGVATIAGLAVLLGLSGEEKRSLLQRARNLLRESRD